MKIIITGASGFVGKNLATYLQRENISIQGLSLRQPSWNNEIDNQTVAIVHLAGKAHDTNNTSSPEDYFTVNRDLTIQLFDEFLNSNIEDFFYFSSVKAVADTLKGILKEDEDPCPFTPYGKSKFEAEQYLQSKVLPEGKRLFIIRPCMIHGPGNKGNLNLLYKIVQKNVPWPLASFHNQRSFLSVDNLSYLIKGMLDNRNVESGVYNFADDDPLSTNTLVSLIANTLDKNASLWHIPKGLVERCVKVGDVLSLPLNSERLKKLTESYVVSNQKIKAALGIDNLPLSAEEGLELTIRSFRSR